MKRCVVDNTTTESLVMLLHENPRGLLMIKDELSGLIFGLNQYKAGGKGDDRQVYLQLWSGDTICNDRKSDKTGEPLFVPDGFLAIIGGTQPDVLDNFRGTRKHGGGPVADGFMDRFLAGYPEGLPAVGEEWREVPEAVLATWDNTVNALINLQMCSEANGQLRPYYVRFSEEGRVAWKALTDHHAAEVNAEGFPNHLRDVWSKMRGYCARLALVLSCLRLASRPVSSSLLDGVPASGDDVIAQDVYGASRLVDYLKGHARKVYAILDADPRVADARRVLRCLAENPDLLESSFTRRDIYQHLRKTFRTPESLDQPLTVLAEHRFLRAIPPARNNGRPGLVPDRYEVNPLWDGRWRPQETSTDHRGEDRKADEVAEDELSGQSPEPHATTQEDPPF